MGRVYILRHGETEGNEKKIFRGRWDLPLSSRGVRQVELAGEALAGVGFSQIFTSPLARARQTAAAAVRFTDGPDARVEESLVDIDYGVWTRRADDDIARNSAELHRLWRNAPGKVRFPGGESLADVRLRVVPLLESFTGTEGNVLLVSHRVPIKVMLCQALGLDDSAFWRLKVDTASVSVIELGPGGVRLLLMNDTSHLGPLARRFGTADF